MKDYKFCKALSFRTLATFFKITSMSDSENSKNYGEDLELSRSASKSNREATSDQFSLNEGQHRQVQSWRVILSLSFSSLGAIYGDIGTSPLYVLNSIKYKSDIPTEKELYGAFSVIFYLFTIIVIFKYIIVVLFFGPNNGEGGQVAIYAKIARTLHMGPKGVVIPGTPVKSDLELLSRQDTSTSMFGADLNHLNKGLKYHPTVLKIVSGIIIFCCFIGCSLVISDGLLTPTTSVLSAVAGIQVAKPSFNDVLAVSEVILILLFLIQRFGSAKISFTFAPIIFLWLLGLLITGIYNVVKYDHSVFKAFSPYYAIELLKEGGIDILGSGMLAITGTEAMFADIGHFGRTPVQLTMGFFVYPSLMFAYLGQVSFIIKHPEAISNPFFLTIPGDKGGAIYWIMFVLATLATIIASQALILGVFSILSQLINLDCFPRLKVEHTSRTYVGKVYIPFANWLLLIGVVATTAGFKNSNNVTAAYGLGISLDFIVTSFLIAICLIYVYKVRLIYVLIFMLIFLPLDFCLAIANLKKVPHGAWFPLVIAGLFFSFLLFWRWGMNLWADTEHSSRVNIRKLVSLDTITLNNPERKVNFAEAIGAQGESDTANSSRDKLEDYKDEINDDKLVINSICGMSEAKRMDCVGILYNESTSSFDLGSPNTVPGIYAAFASGFASIPSVFIFCSTRTLSIPYVPDQDRILVARSKLKGHYRCIIRFGFMENIKISEHTINDLLKKIPEYIKLEDKYANSTIESQKVPLLHIFQNNVLKARSTSFHEVWTKRVLLRIQNFFRSVALNYVFSTIMYLENSKGSLVEIEDSQDNTKLVLGKIVEL